MLPTPCICEPKAGKIHPLGGTQLLPSILGCCFSSLGAVLRRLLTQQHVRSSIMTVFVVESASLFPDTLWVETSWWKTSVSTVQLSVPRPRVRPLSVKRNLGPGLPIHKKTYTVADLQVQLRCGKHDNTNSENRMAFIGFPPGQSEVKTRNGHRSRRQDPTACVEFSKR